VLGFFKIGSIFLGLALDFIPLGPGGVAGITGVRHWHLAREQSLIELLHVTIQPYNKNIHD
jgi:hypothetical protein